MLLLLLLWRTLTTALILLWCLLLLLLEGEMIWAGVLLLDATAFLVELQRILLLAAANSGCC